MKRWDVAATLWLFGLVARGRESVPLTALRAGCLLVFAVALGAGVHFAVMEILYR